MEQCLVKNGKIHNTKNVTITIENNSFSSENIQEYCIRNGLIMIK